MQFLSHKNSPVWLRSCCWANISIQKGPFHPTLSRSWKEHPQPDSISSSHSGSCWSELDGLYQSLSHTHNTVTTSVPLPPGYWQTILKRPLIYFKNVCGHSQPFVANNNSHRMHKNTSMKMKFKNNHNALTEVSKQTSNPNLKQLTPSFPGAQESQVHPNTGGHQEPFPESQLHL